MDTRGKWYTWGPVVLALVLCTASVAVAGSWLIVAPDGTVGVKEGARPAAPVTTARDEQFRGFQMTVNAAGLALEPIKNEFGEFARITLPDGGVAGEIGAPAIPVVRRLFIAPQGATVSVSTQAGAAYPVESAAVGARLRLEPNQAPVPKVPGALENAPFAFNAGAYAVNTDLAPQRVTVTELGIVRGQRLMLLEVWPVSYNPATEQMSFYPQIVANVRFAGGMADTSGLSSMPGLGTCVVNPSVLPATRAGGNYVIIVASTYASAISTFANAKTAQGFTVTTWSAAPGTTTTTIKNYIQGLWGNPNTAPDYILLVGDTDTIPYWTGGGEGSPITDIQYGCMDGASDWYPDIAIGRFSVRSTTQLDNIVNKTLYYENGPLADPDYVKRAVFMASSDNYTVSEGTHNYVIETYMAPNEIACDKLYCHTYGATPAQTTAAFNDGRFFGIYSGHGAETYWADGPIYYPADVNALTNLHMYAYIYSFSCLTGTFSEDECFMETWVRAANKGAAVAIGSSVTSYWTEDDILERKLFDAIYDENQPTVAKEVGPILNEAKLRHLAYFGPTATTRRYFEMYNIFGDPAMTFPGNCSDAGTVQADRTRYACSDTVSVRVADCGLNTDPNTAQTISVPISSTSETGETVLLTETNPNSATFVGDISISTTNAAGVLLVAPGDTITVTYQDADNGQGQPATVTSTATVDCVGPTISNVHATNLQARTATIAMTTNESAQGVVHYGLSCNTLNLLASGGGYSTAPTVDLSGLQDNTTYYYKVDAVDEAGNLGSDTNCYSFTTPEIPDYFTQLFTADNDLDFLTLQFTPNGSSDFYAGCAQPITDLPTDPAGGTTVTLTDDGNAAVTLTGGAQVYLYGVAYSTFYIGANGYVTFGSSDSDYSETLEEHFAKPRIAALYDDLGPHQGGTVSWKQLSDRAVVTYLNVPQLSAADQNTFQIEMFYNGKITINFLAIAATDGLAGLSAGTGLSPDYYASDLSAMLGCQTLPPTAHNGIAVTQPGTPVTVTLSATDDGSPFPPGAMTYIITALPPHGSLYDPQGGVIGGVPYTLLLNGNHVSYHPAAYFSGSDSFQFMANDGGTPPDGGDSNVATIAVTVGGPQCAYDFDLDTNPGWSTQGAWAFGVPTGGGSHNLDPTSGHTGANVYGYNLNGDYASNMTQTLYLTTTAINCTNITSAQLKFWRRLGVESAQFDHANLQISNNGTTWVTLWNHTATTAITDAAWTQLTYDISAVADSQPTVFIRWGMGPTDTSITYPGWNIDDVEVWGWVPLVPVAGDMNCDGVVNNQDIDAFVLGLFNPDGYAQQYPECDILNGDFTGDGVLNNQDIDAFVAALFG